MDGYALNGNGSHRDGYLLLPSSEVKDAPQNSVEPFSTRILTGRPVFGWTKCISAQEHCKVLNNRVFPGAIYPEGHNIRRAGEDAAVGGLLLQKGRTLDATAIARLASAGISMVPLRKRPRVGILTGGDEIVRLPTIPDSKAPRFECDSFLLQGMLSEFGASPLVFPHLPDDPAVIKATIEDAPTLDMLLTCGGAAESELDFIRPILKELGTDFLFERVAMKPGRPTAFGFLGPIPVFCLPGNPVAVFSAFHALVRPALALMMGQLASSKPSRKIPLGKAFPNDPNRHRLVRAVIDWSANPPKAFPYPDSGSGLVRSLVDCNSLLSLPCGEDLPVGFLAEVLWMRNGEG